MEKKSPTNLIQPNKVTNARYEFSEREEDILTLIIDAVQKHMTKESNIQTDLFKQPMIEIDLKEVGANNKKQYLEASSKLRKKDIKFEWNHPETHELVETETSIITAIHNHKQSSKLQLTISQWAIPYLLYWGKGVGATLFDKSVALTLKGSYTKRLYKICSRWKDQKGFTMSLKEFREMLEIEDKYPNTGHLRTRVLDPAQDRMKESADIYFNYAFHKVAGSRSYNSISFSIHPNNGNLPEDKKTEVYHVVYNHLGRIWNPMKSSKCRENTDLIANNPDNLEKLYHKIKFWNKQEEEGTKTSTDIIKITRHALKNDYGIE